jgi:hypothetical protein
MEYCRDCWGVLVTARAGARGRGVGHNPPQEALEAFAEAEAVVEVDGC